MDHILIVSHCIINSASKVISYNEKEINEEEENRRKLLDYIIKNNIQLLQLPCPEMLLYGSKRWGHVKEQFEHSYFRKECRNMLEPIIAQLKEYLKNPKRFRIMGIVAIDGSPSCGYKSTCKGNWGGEFDGCPDIEKKIKSVYMANESGVFMEEFKKVLEAENLDIPMKDLREIVREFNL